MRKWTKDIALLITDCDIDMLVTCLEEQYEMDGNTLATGREDVGLDITEWNKCVTEHKQLKHLIERVLTQIQVHEIARNVRV